MLLRLSRDITLGRRRTAASTPPSTQMVQRGICSRPPAPCPRDDRPGGGGGGGGGSGWLMDHRIRADGQGTAIDTQGRPGAACCHPRCVGFAVLASLWRHEPC